MRACTEFLVREALQLLLDDPTPRNVAEAMGPAYAQDVSLSMESQTEESESQAPFVPEASKRVMLVASTKSAQQSVVATDGKFSINAYIPQALVEELKAKHGYKSIGKLPGSTIRIDQFHFSTYERCYALDHANTKRPQSVSTKKSRGSVAPIWLYVEAMSVVVEGDLVAGSEPDIQHQPAIAAKLKMLTATELETRLMLRQGRSPAASLPGRLPPKVFGEDNPLTDIDAEVPDEQDQDLDERGWGAGEDVEPTDSQLIADNGPVSSGDSQPSAVSSEGNAIVSSSASSDTFVVSSGETSSQSPHKVRLIVPETVSQSASPSKAHVNDDASVPDSQEYFQRENLSKAFKDCSDSNSDTDSEPGQAEDGEHSEASRSLAQDASQGGQSSSQAPFTQQQSLDASLTLSDTEPTLASQASQPPGEFVGSVDADHDEPMTQAPDDSQPLEESAAGSLVQLGSQRTQAEDASHPVEDKSADESDDTPPADPDFGSPSDEADNITPNEVVDSPNSDGEMDRNEGKEDERLRNLPDAEASETEEKQDVDASQQDGQTDHWMQSSQPTPPKARQSKAVASPASASSQSGGNVTQRRKRRRSSVVASESQPLSPREPSAKASRTQYTTDPTPSKARSFSVAKGSSEETSASRDQGTVVPGSNMLTTRSSVASAVSTSSVNRAISIGISSFNNKANHAQLQRLRPAERYRHLLPPFDLEKIKQQILNKKN